MTHYITRKTRVVVDIIQLSYQNLSLIKKNTTEIWQLTISLIKLILIERFQIQTILVEKKHGSIVFIYLLIKQIEKRMYKDAIIQQ